MNPISRPFEDFESVGWVDKDGLLIPDKWRLSERGVANWEAIPFRMRQGMSEEFAKPKPEIKEKVARVGGKAFTTKAAKAWGKLQGWKLIDEENSTLRKVGKKFIRRTNDLMIGSDLMFECPGIPGMTLVQAAGQSERKAHFERFQERGGVDACRRRVCRFVYAEFVRGQSEPIKIEWWVA